jgi:hypothetical protein
MGKHGTLQAAIVPSLNDGNHLLLHQENIENINHFHLLLQNDILFHFVLQNQLI